MRGIMEPIEDDPRLAEETEECIISDVSFNKIMTPEELAELEAFVETLPPKIL